MLGEPDRDVVLLSIDCFRHDSPAVMPNLQSMVGSDDIQTEAIASSYKTPLVSPSMLQSRLFPDVLRDAGGPDREAYTRYSVDDSTPSLPRVLSREGYSTAAFIAANPYLRQYVDHFDVFWDGFDESSLRGRLGTVRALTSRIKRTVTLQKQVPGGVLVEEARRWYVDTDGPRFLWLHFMEPHFPYYPGMQRGRDVGLLDAYLTSIRKFRSDESTDLPDRVVETLRRLHTECVRRVDDLLPRAFEFIDDDAIIVLTGDHGEAFDHRPIGHNVLYDEVIRVPLFLLNAPKTAYDGRTVRQLDIAPTLVETVGVSPPVEWEGAPIAENHPLKTLLVMATPKRDRPVCSLGIRTATEKFIRGYDFDRARYTQSEYYDLTVDPGETENRYDRENPPKLQERLDREVEARNLLAKMEKFDRGHGTTSRSQLAAQVENRLTELGYT